jgi:hypothetical protein
MPDSVAYVYRNSIQIGRAAFTLDKKVGLTGTHVYSALENVDSNGPRDWLTITSVSGGEGEAPDVKALSELVKMPSRFLEKARSVITAGTTLIITDLPVSTNTRSEQDFSIMKVEQAKPAEGK